MSYPKQPGLSCELFIQSIRSWKHFVRGRYGREKLKWFDLITTGGRERCLFLFFYVFVCVCVVIASRRRRRRHNSPDWTSMGIPIGWYGLPTTCATNSTFDGRGADVYRLVITKEEEKVVCISDLFRIWKTDVYNDSLLQPLSSFNHVHHLFLPPIATLAWLDPYTVDLSNRLNKLESRLEKKKKKHTRRENVSIFLVMSPSNCLRHSVWLSSGFDRPTFQIESSSNINASPPHLCTPLVVVGGKSKFHAPFNIFFFFF